MATIDRIRAGLKQMEESGSDSTANMSPSLRLSALAGLDVSLHSAKMHRHKAKTLNSEIASMHRSLAKAIEAESSRIEREYDALGYVPHESGHGQEDILTPTKRLELRNAALAEMQKRLKKGVAERAEPLRAKVREAEEKLGYLREAWSTPLVFLYRVTAMSQDRLTAQGILANAGAYQLNQAADDAIRRQNRDLAAAVCSVSEKMKPDQRELLKFTREELSASVGFGEYFEAFEALEMCGLELASAELDGRELVGVKVRPEQRSSLGRRKMDVAKSLGKSLEELGQGSE